MIDPKRHAEFHERQNHAFDSLLKAACSCVPRGWRSAVLELEVSFNPFTNRRAISHRLRDPDSEAEIKDFPEALFQATTELHTVFTAYDQAWKRGTLTLQFDEHGRMRKANAAYDYSG